MSNSPFSPWWYYEMGREAGKQIKKSSNSDKPNQNAGSSIVGFFLGPAFVISIIITILLFVGLIAVCIWYFL